MQVASMSLDRSLLPAILSAYDVLWEFSDTLVAEHEKSSICEGESLLDALIESKNAGGLDERELRYLLMVLLLAGYDTSKNLLTLTMHMMLEHPDMWQRCAKEMDYCKKVVAEMLRHSSITSPCRTLREDVDYDGIRFPKGTFLCFALSLTGRDPSVFSDPLEFNPDRSGESRHIAFGRGTHFCLGQFLATAQLEEGIHLIAQRITAPRVSGEITWRPFLGAWGLRTLPIKFEPVHAVAVEEPTQDKV
jgi:cytochrome P450